MSINMTRSTLSSATIDENGFVNTLSNLKQYLEGGTTSSFHSDHFSVEHINVLDEQFDLIVTVYGSKQQRRVTILHVSELFKTQRRDGAKNGKLIVEYRETCGRSPHYTGTLEMRELVNVLNITPKPVNESKTILKHESLSVVLTKDHNALTIPAEYKVSSFDHLILNDHIVNSIESKEKAIDCTDMKTWALLHSVPDSPAGLVRMCDLLKAGGVKEKELDFTKGHCAITRSFVKHFDLYDELDILRGLLIEASVNDGDICRTILTSDNTASHIVFKYSHSELSSPEERVYEIDITNVENKELWVIAISNLRSELANNRINNVTHVTPT